MKLRPSHVSRPIRTLIGVFSLAASLLAGPGTASASTMPPSAPPAASPTAKTTDTKGGADGQKTQPSSPVPSVAAQTPKPTSTTPPPPPSQPVPGTDTAEPASSESLADVLAAGGAEMGQRSSRVKETSTTARLLRAQALSSEGTWTPSFGVQGIDVSGHQPSVDWRQQWNMGARFAYVKASEGNYYTNPSYSAQFTGSRNVGMIRGAYHFAIPNWSSGADQARFFIRNGGNWSADGSTLPPVLDFEFNPYEGRTIDGFYFGNTCYGMSPAQLGAWVKDFGNTVRSLTGRLPVIYTNTSWWNQCLGNPAGFGDYPLWIAAYPNSPTNNAGAVPTGSWSSYSIWQYSSKGPFVGDSNVWNGDLASLKTFAQNGSPGAAMKQVADYRAAHPALGSATTSLVCGLAQGGCYQGFSGGTVMWSSSSGAFAVVAGAVTAAWVAGGAENGAAGYPTGDITCGLKNNGCFQNFQSGSILTSPASGWGLIQSGAIRDYWAKSGYEGGPLGYPTGAMTCGLKDGGCFQLFQAGSVLSSPASGAHVIKAGAVFDAWSRAGFENGLLGFPIRDVSCSGGNCTQDFTGGTIASTPANGAWPIFMGIAGAWKESRAQSPVIGFPIGSEVCGLRAGGCFQLFQGGTLMFSPTTGAFTLTARMLEYWQKSGFENGVLGYPTSTVTCGVPNSECTQSFERGTVAFSPKTGIQSVPAGAIRDSWNTSGSTAGQLGYPTSAQYCGLKDGGCFQMFAKGAIMFSPSTGAHPSISGPIRDFWQTTGFENGSFGYPTGNVVCGLLNSGCFQNYRGGSIMWSKSTGAQPLEFGPIRDAWVRSGFEGGVLGYPAGTRICGLTGGGCFQNFEKGTVMWSPMTGGQRVTSAPIQRRWAQSGFESGQLGYPSSDSICGLKNAGCFQNFEKGTILWSSSSGAHPITPGPIQQAWASQGFETGPVGFPISAQTCTSDGRSCSQNFQSGKISWTSTGGAVIRR